MYSTNAAANTFEYGTECRAEEAEPNVDPDWSM